jgi:phosphoenolpyruvate-protein phosphotransferase/dihydroxyacetone kinase phosphotransfer subunit
MVGVVLVSHSRALALAVQELVRAMTGPALPLAVAAGAGDNHAELGTDAVEISEAITSVHGPDGVLVLMDMGSAILSAETALDLLDETLRVGVKFCAAPFVEGAVAAGVTANLGAPLDDVHAEAIAALKQKETALAPSDAETEPVAPNGKPERAAGDVLPEQKIRVTVRNLHGLHARPAARLIREMRAFQSEISVRNLGNQHGPVSIKSLSSLASLEILQDNEVEFSARGDDAGAALEKIRRLVEGGLGDPLSAQNGTAPRAKTKPAPCPKKAGSGPIPVSGGIAIGPGIYFQDAELRVPRQTITDVCAEIGRLRDAVAQAQKAIEARGGQMSASVGAGNAAIYEAQILALQDPELIENAVRIINDEQANAALAWDRANRQVAARYQALQDDYLRERAADLEDVGRQVLELLGVEKSEGPAFAIPSILITENLTPFQVSSLPRQFAQGVILLDGGPTAHSSILLKALGIPAIVQARSNCASLDLKQPGTIAFDGSTGEIWLQPDAALLRKLTERQAAERRRHEEESFTSRQPGATLDGQRIEIMANVGDIAAAEVALTLGAEGVGLLRTEFLFLDRDSAPTEDEQMNVLHAVGEKMNGRPVIVRTLDAGGDKELPYLHMPPEDNPFLGVRAIRLCFAHEELFTTQLRAILRAAHGRDFRIMFPMIANVTDLARAKECVAKVHRDLEKENVPHLWPIQTGIMIEIPSAALQAEALAEHADFFSIGTNDLTQYTLAADRGNPELAPYQDALHPAVLRLIDMVVRGAAKYDRLVAVCGEAASDETAATVFVGLGVRELSMASASIPRIKACLRKKALPDLQKLAQAALNCHGASEVRRLVNSA